MLPFVCEKTNLIKVCCKLLGARESGQKSADLCFSAVARRTTVLRTAEKQAPEKLSAQIKTEIYIVAQLWKNLNVTLCVKGVDLCTSFP